jgi:hypothetical protein
MLKSRKEHGIQDLSNLTECSIQLRKDFSGKGTTTMKFARFGIALLAAPLLLWLMSGTARAAPPSNDTFAGATPASIGFSEVLDTSQATTDGDDAQLNTWCGAPTTDASVWYAIQGSGQGVIVDVWQSNYSAGVLVGVGSPGNLQTVTCGPGAVAFSAAAGTTYYVLAIDDQYDGGGNGGSLSISFREVPPPPKVDISVDRFGTVNPRTGVATISGTYTCSNGDYLYVYVEARQNVGRIASISGYGYFSDFGTCDGTPRAWSADVLPQSGKFAGGKSLTLTFAQSCGQSACSTGYVEQTVQLRDGPR